MHGFARGLGFYASLGNPLFYCVQKGVWLLARRFSRRLWKLAAECRCMYVYWSVNTHSSECSEVFGRQEGGKISKYADICVFSWLPKKHFQKLKTLIWTWISDWNLSGNSHSGHGSDNRWHLMSVHYILALGTPKLEWLLRRLTILFQKSNQTKSSYHSLVILLTVSPWSELLCIYLKWCCKTLTHDMENASSILADKGGLWKFSMNV